MTREPSELRVPDADLEELRSRLRGTRWPPPWPPRDAGSGWEAGTDSDELRRLVTYWADEYDWRLQEAAINALPGQMASPDGTDVFYLRFDAEVPGALPIVLTHGSRRCRPRRPPTSSGAGLCTTSWALLAMPRTAGTSAPVSHRG
jgi:Epoxide hydrolase N terminus